MLVIDGSYGLGSGQMARFALAFSCLTQEPVTITNIRAKRPQPGLKNQHLHAVKALQQLCSAEVEGAALQSSKVVFRPGRLIGGDLKIQIGTAGSIPLLLQNVLLPLMFADKPSTLTITGGTDVAFSPTIDYFSEVVLPFFKPYAKEISIKVKRRGYFPKGGGKVVFSVTPKYRRHEYSSFQAFVAALRHAEQPLSLLERGDLVSIHCVSHAADRLQHAHVAERQVKGAVAQIDSPVDAELFYDSCLGMGSGITLWAKTANSVLGADSLGERDKKAELVGEEAGKKLMHELTTNAHVDVHNADNLVPLLCLLTGKIHTSAISEHTKTALWLVAQFMDVVVDYHDNIISVE